MNGYIKTGYIVALGTLGIYGTTLLQRERRIRRRLSSIAAVTAKRDASEVASVVQEVAADDETEDR